MAMQMNMQFHTNYNGFILSKFAVKVSILLFFTISRHFPATYLQSKIKSHKNLVHLFYHGNADGHAN